LSRSASVAEPIDYMLKRWDRFARFIDDGRICLTNNAAERALRGFALGRKSWLFAGSERGADRAAAMATLIMTATTSIHWLGSLTCSLASPAFRKAGFTSYCLGNGSAPGPLSLRRPDHYHAGSERSSTGCASFWRAIGELYASGPGCASS
jgi:hypothetical protein